MEPRPVYQLPIHYVPVINVADTTCPPYGVCEASGVDEETGFANIDKPSADNTSTVFFNGPTAIPAGGKGQAHQSFPAIAAYQTDNDDAADPAHGEQWGVRSGSWYLHKDLTGFQVIGDGGYGLCNVQRANASGGSGDLFITGEFAGGGDGGHIQTVDGVDFPGSPTRDTPGQNAVDLQQRRDDAAQAATGQESAILAGRNNTASGRGAVVLGGFGNVASGNFGAVAMGTNAVADRSGEFAMALADQDPTTYAWGQHVDFDAYGITTNAGAVAIPINANEDKALFLIVTITGILQGGSKMCHFVRKVAVKNVAGTVTVLGSATAVGTDQSDDGSYAVGFSTGLGVLNINVTGKALEYLTWWLHFEGIERTWTT